MSEKLKNIGFVDKFGVLKPKRTYDIVLGEPVGFLNQEQIELSWGAKNIVDGDGIGAEPTIVFEAVKK